MGAQAQRPWTTDLGAWTLALYIGDIDGPLRILGCWGADDRFSCLNEFLGERKVWSLAILQKRMVLRDLKAPSRVSGYLQLKTHSETHGSGKHSVKFLAV